MAMSKTLVLSAEWMPINVVSVMRAIAKVFNERAVIVHPDTYAVFSWEDWVSEWDDAVKLAKFDASRMMSFAGGVMVAPEIIVCKKYHGLGYKVNNRHRPKFSRRNLFLRDRNKCQICGKKLPSSELTMEHILPRSKGGDTSWMNIVLACTPCNNRKGDKTLAASGMRLIRQPFIPTSEDLKLSPTDRIKRRIVSRPPKTWEHFLDKTISEMYWNVELQN